ncbi:MAG TPA: hypothetical protein VMT17_00545 [Anaeromyxobacteraceae bacterium]|nr:hypothetical protein [Anaeromyxobacteraceae bacterium]
MRALTSSDDRPGLLSRRTSCENGRVTPADRATVAHLERKRRGTGAHGTGRLAPFQVRGSERCAGVRFG